MVDGPVSDEINEVIEKYESCYNMRVIRFETNMGLGNALKIATENCTHELIARMDSDDVAVANRFEQQLEYLDNHPNVDIVGGIISEFVGDECNIISYRNVPLTDFDIKKYAKKRCPFNHMTVMFKKTTVYKAGGYLDLHYNEDYYLWIRMLLIGAVFANLGSVLVNVRTGVDQFSRRGGLKYYKSEKKIQHFMLKNKLINIIRYSINCFTRFVIQVIMPSKLRGFIYKKMLHANKQPYNE